MAHLNQILPTSMKLGSSFRVPWKKTKPQWFNEWYKCKWIIFQRGWISAIHLFWVSQFTKPLFFERELFIPVAGTFCDLKLTAKKTIKKTTCRSWRKVNHQFLHRRCTQVKTSSHPHVTLISIKQSRQCDLENLLSSGTYKYGMSLIRTKPSCSFHTGILFHEFDILQCKCNVNVRCFVIVMLQ